MPLTAAQAAAKWQTNYSSAGKAFEEGIQGITENPMEKAAQQKDAWLAGIMQAASEGTWEEGLRAVDFQKWKAKTIRLGKLRMADGAKEGAESMTKFMNVWLPYMDALRAKLQSMPKVTKADRRARMIAAFDHNSDFVYRRR